MFYLTLITLQRGANLPAGKTTRAFFTHLYESSECQTGSNAILSF